MSPQVHNSKLEAESSIAARLAKADARRFADAMIRDYGEWAETNALMRARLLETEGNHTTADLWRRIADLIRNPRRSAGR
jgi:hypothetical protein